MRWTGGSGDAGSPVRAGDSMTRLIDYTFDGPWLTYVDERQLSAPLRQKLDRGRRAGNPPVHRGTDRSGGSGVLLGAAGALGSIVLIALILTGTGPLVVRGVVLATVVTAVGAAVWWSARSTTSLTASDRRDVAAATKRLYVPDSSAAPALQVDSFDEFPVPELIARAVELRDSIADSPAWQSGYLASHRLRLDLDAELDQIIQHALRMECVAGPLAEPVGDSATATTTRQATEYVRTSLEWVWAGLVSRVSALTAYHAHLGELETELINAGIAERTAGAGVDIAELIAAAAGAELAADHLAGLGEEVRAMALAINEIVETLNGDLGTLAALSVPQL
ncbi:hypothetical protein BOX37_26495 [Nocardia mangyaensis]|uniref:Uncharacterized protein n=2 Tax=Nocardia mangyaensis TaxID=2213200 RepID=A0A1J0VXV8_9NOCA|nr:hypothetical protein BOX37_26495 [Nocardia mangyaensis]